MNSESDLDKLVERFANPQGEFFRQFRNTIRKYRPTLSDEGIRDLFQDSFIAAKKNLDEGKVRENTSWDTYIIAIGLNLSSHEFRSFGRFTSLDSAGSPSQGSGMNEMHHYLYDRSEEMVEDYNTPEVQRVLAEALEFMNETCRKILEWTLYSNLSGEEIAAMLNSTANSVKTRRNRCKMKLMEIMKVSLRSLGYEIQ